MEEASESFELDGLNKTSNTRHSKNPAKENILERDQGLWNQRQFISESFIQDDFLVHTGGGNLPRLLSIQQGHRPEQCVSDLLEYLHLVF